jgi:mannose-6-phosphate isomerase-like protein (cupin superfamily)
MDIEKQPLIIRQGEGRNYNMGAMQAVFLADESETNQEYCISEWWLDANSKGPGAHFHEENDEIFYVLEGVMSFLVGDSWVDASKGTFLRIPSKLMHDFANNTNERAGVLNFFIPGGFERNMPSIVSWFENNK